MRLKEFRHATIPPDLLQEGQVESEATVSYRGGQYIPHTFCNQRNDPWLLAIPKMGPRIRARATDLRGVGGGPGAKPTPTPSHVASRPPSLPAA